MKVFIFLLLSFNLSAQFTLDKMVVKPEISGNIFLIPAPTMDTVVTLLEDRLIIRGNYIHMGVKLDNAYRTIAMLDYVVKFDTDLINDLQKLIDLDINELEAEVSLLNTNISIMADFIVTERNDLITKNRKLTRNAWVTTPIFVAAVAFLLLK
jgi:hypothetical protein